MWWKKFLIYAARSYNIDFTAEEAAATRKMFFEDHAGLLAWYKRVEAFGRKHGYVESPSGRRRHLPALQLDYEGSKEKERLYKDAVRMAINAPVQGFGSGDLKYMGIIAFRKEMKARGWYDFKMMILGEVHDSVVYWVDEDIAIEVSKIAVECMRNPPLLKEFDINLKVPIEAEAGLGPSYGETIDLNEYIQLKNDGITFEELAYYIDLRGKRHSYQEAVDALVAKRKVNK